MKPKELDGFTITYNIDAGNSTTQTISAGSSILDYSPTKDGYTFVGWREDTTANETVLSGTTATKDMTLYAVFSKSITVSYNANGGSGSIASQSGTVYYNNGNTVGATFTLSNNGFSYTSCTFQKWAMGSASGTQYAAGTSVTLTNNTTFYAVWLQSGATATALVNRNYNFDSTGWNVIPFTNFSVVPNNSEYFTISGDYKYITVKKSCNVTVTWTQTLDGGAPRSALTTNGSTIPYDFIFEVDSGTYTKTIYLAAGTTISIIFGTTINGITSSIGWCSLKLVV